MVSCLSPYWSSSHCTCSESCAPGDAFKLDKIQVSDLEAGKLDVSWIPTEGHQSFAGEEAIKIIKAAYIGILLNGINGGWDVGDDFNLIFADHTFEPIESFVERVWQGKP